MIIIIVFVIYCRAGKTIYQSRRNLQDAERSPENTTGRYISPVAQAQTSCITTGLRQPSPRRGHHDRQNASWTYTRNALLFFTALLLTWIPSSINRVSSVINQRSNPSLEIFSACVLPLQGFWNGMIYAAVSWGSYKEAMNHLSQKVKLCRSKMFRHRHMAAEPKSAKSEHSTLYITCMAASGAKNNAAVSSIYLGSRGASDDDLLCR